MENGLEVASSDSESTVMIGRGGLIDLSCGDSVWLCCKRELLGAEDKVDVDGWCIVLPGRLIAASAIEAAGSLDGPLDIVDSGTGAESIERDIEFFPVELEDVELDLSFLVLLDSVADFCAGALGGAFLKKSLIVLF